MKPHPRIRKTIKYGGAALTVLLVVAWFISAKWAMGYGSPQMLVLLSREGFVASVYNDPFLPDVGWFVWSAQEAETWRWWFEYLPMRTGKQLSVPIWTVTLLALIITALAFRLDTLARRRERMNLCKHCGYDRTGLAAGTVCPECGGAAANPHLG